MRNERTSAAIAKIAGKLMKKLQLHKPLPTLFAWIDGTPYILVKDLQALAASALTQAPDKKRKR